MTRKYLVRVALAIRCIRDYRDRLFVATEIGDIMKESNQLFDWGKWRIACGLEDKMERAETLEY